MIPWVLFLVLVFALLALDLGVVNREAHVVSIRESLRWTLVWIAVSLAFNAVVYFAYEHHWFGIGRHIGHDLGGREAAIQFFTGYVIEKSLSVDNIFVIALIFSHFRVPKQHQHRTLFWGIVGAVVMRGAMIAAGAALIARFDWMAYVFGALLLFTAVRMMVGGHGDVDPSRSLLVRIARRIYPVSGEFDGPRFFTRTAAGTRAMTPMFVALLAVEGADVLFAVDSIPAVFAVTRDPFLVFTSNIFAILGLRALYFALAAAMDRFRYIQASLVFLLSFIGVKMILQHHFPIPAWVSLVVIGGILGTGVAASVWANIKVARLHAAPPPQEEDDTP